MGLKRKTRIEPITDGRSQQTLDRKTYIIHHYCPHTFNAGDHFVIRSIRKHLLAHLPQALFVPKASAHNRGWGQPVGLRGSNINHSNRYADAVIVGGSDHYNDWSLRIREKEIRQLNPPLYLIGLGISSKDLDSSPVFSKKSYYKDLLVTHQQARLSSVRDHTTQRFLESAGFDESVVTGCPALYLYEAPFSFTGDGTAAITFPFPVIRGSNSAGHARLIAAIRSILPLVKRLGMKPVIVAHDDRDIKVAQSLFPEETLFFSNYVDEFCHFYETTSMVIGSRLHATILAAGMGKPFININLDARGRGFSETFGLEDWNLDLDNEQLLSDLEGRIRTIQIGDLTTFENFYRVKSEYRRTFLDFVKQVAADIQNRSARNP